MPAPEASVHDTKRTVQDNRRPVSQTSEPAAEEPPEENLFAPPRKRKAETAADDAKITSDPSARRRPETAKGDHKNNDDPDDLPF